MPETVSLQQLDEQNVCEILRIEQACNDKPWSEKLLRSCIGGRYFNAGISVGEALVGFYIAEQAGPDITLMEICVHPQHQGQGLSKLLMKDLLAQSQQRNAEAIFLEVRKSNLAAIGLYQHFGFTKSGIRKGYYSDGEDAQLMCLMLD